MSDLPDDPTLDEIRAAMAPVVASNAAFDGWGDEARDAGADALGIDRDVALLAFPGGAVEMVAAWFAQIDAEMLAALPPERLAAMKIRERIAAGEDPEAIRAWLIERYGDWISYKPTNDPILWPLWAAPVLLLGAGGALAWGRIRRRKAKA